jgi:hypothetical protein
MRNSSQELPITFAKETSAFEPLRARPAFGDQNMRRKITRLNVVMPASNSKFCDLLAAVAAGGRGDRHDHAHSVADVNSMN